MMKNYKKVFIFFLLSSLMILTTSCGEGTISNTETTYPITTVPTNAATLTTTTITTTKVTTETAKEVVLKIGETGTLSNWEITVNSFKVKKSISSGYGYYSPEDGNKYLVVDITIKNIGTQSASFMPYVSIGNNAKIHLEYNDYIFTADKLLGCDDDLYDRVLNPLSSATGICAFDVAPEVADSNEIQLVIECGKQSIVYNLSK